MKTTSAPPVALIAGPTASGKSAIAVKLAQALAKRGQTGVVINADSAQVYADLQILSARPTEDEMAGIEHRLFGTWDGAEACSVAHSRKAGALHDANQISPVRPVASIPAMIDSRS